MAELGKAISVLSSAHELGVSLSFALMGFVGDVKGETNRIRIPADEVFSTAQRLKDLGDLIEKIDETKLSTEDCLVETIWLGEGCERAFTEIRFCLKKAGVTIDPTEAKEDDIDVDWFSDWLWPWTKVVLAPCEADLATLRAELHLLYLVIMANTASTATERSEYAQAIPGFHRSGISANAEQHRAWKRRAELSIQRRAPYFPDGHPCTVVPELKEEKKAHEEKEKVKERERLAVEDWTVKRGGDEEKRHEKLEKDRDRLRERLLQENLSNDQIQSILADLNIDDSLSVRSGSGREGSPDFNRNEGQTTTRIVEHTFPKPESMISRILSYLGKGTLRSSLYTSLTSSASSRAPPLLDLGPGLKPGIRFEAWALKHDPYQQTRLPLPGRWIEQNATEKICPSKSLLKRFSFLQPHYKAQINRLIEWNNAGETSHEWFLVSLQAVNKVFRENLIRRHEVEICVLIVLGRLRRDDVYSDGNPDFSNGASTKRSRRGPFPGAFPNAGRSQPWRVSASDPPAPLFGRSSAPPRPIPLTPLPIPPPGPPPYWGRAHTDRERSPAPLHSYMKRRPWVRISKRHISLVTLMEFNIPWELDRFDPSYVIINRWVPEWEQDILFDHTKRFREDRFRLSSSALSDDDYESFISNVEGKGKVLARMKSEKDDDLPAKEADEEIIEYYLSLYGSKRDVAANSPAPIDKVPGITHMDTVAQATNTAGQATDEPRTSSEEQATRAAGTEVWHDAKTSALG